MEKFMTSSSIPMDDTRVIGDKEPEAILDRMIVKGSNKAVTKVAIDPKRFIGLHSVADAVEYLHSGKSVGKVVVSVDPNFLPLEAKL
ncbi:hypothetical protein ACSQ67_008096 [Phaseolus vulgaris]